MPDAIDALDFTDTFENPERYEESISQIYRDARSDRALADVLRENFLQEDRAQAFQDFAQSGIPANFDQLLALLGLSKDAKICDLGSGPGFLAYALSQMGYKNLTAMDPNGEWFTGTGYLRSIAPQIEVINDLSVWRKIFNRFDAIVSRATVHHWQHIPMIAIDARRTLKSGAHWIVFDEFFATSPHELVERMNGHPLASRYRTYEWCYPTSVYVDLMKSVGLDLVGIGDARRLRSKSDLARSTRRFCRQVYRIHRYGCGDVDNQAMIFQRADLNETPKTFANFIAGRLPIPRTPRYFLQFLRRRGKFQFRP